MKRALVLFVLISLTMLSSSCGSGENSPSGSLPGTAKGARLPIGFLDAPRSGQQIRTGFVVTGWAYSDAGLQDVTIYMDNKPWATAQLGGDRPDLPPLFPQHANIGKAGFRHQLSLSGVNPGAHEITVQARSREGATRDLGTAAVQVVP